MIWILLGLGLLFFSKIVAGQAAIVGYTPSASPCPDGTSLVRLAGTTNQTLSPNEASYISSRKSDVLVGAWKSYLSNVQSTNVALPSYVSAILSGGNSSSSYPTLGIATSGGGYRASIFGAGVLNAIDGRNSTSTQAGTGGLLQAASYLAGLSGGSWLVGSLAQANFPTLPDLIFGTGTGSNDSFESGWLAQYDVLTPNNNTAEDSLYVAELITEIQGKKAAGFPVTITDIWARALSRHFVNGTTPDNFASNATAHGAGVLFSQIAGLSSFTSYQMPFPIIVTDSVANSENKSDIINGDVVPQGNPIYEINVFEMGSYDPVLAAFIPTKYLGSQNNSVCVTGFDQVSFVEGTSSELFNAYNVTLAALLNSTVGPIIEALNSSTPEPGIELDVSLYPNPFFGVANQTYIDTNQEYLSLVDGGEDGEVIPIQPLLVKARGVDVILAIDATSDVDNFSEGSSLIAAQNRSSHFPSAYAFPPVPTSIPGFTSQNLSTHPTFFGCNETSSPLLIYLANGGPPPGQPALTNTSTSQLAYQPTQLQAMLDQVFTIATQGYTNATSSKDPEWAGCLACAVVDRARARMGTARSGVCADCFTRYCWNVNNSQSESSNSSGRRNGAAGSSLGAAVLTAIAGLLMLF
ncbi:hypothetical protein JAAARDRAFT_58053 [Jaapia argillacea MUCL 33604]|uniref:Lysophospholipase n=1 Tax=Jaapia argillacea MUCL 33604 TaxID=933084 RepID=A0A067PRT7_9AGAM|nr:hypothetical protein JAAARDRAFT_58053 [Jaapia argillacea MUCL 33604]